MLLNEQETACLKQLAKWFGENRTMTDWDWAFRQQSRISEAQYEVLLRTMEDLGAIKEHYGADDKAYANFTLSANAVQLVREIEHNSIVQSQPDIVEQIKARFHRNPLAAWIIVAAFALAFIATVLNQVIELIGKFTAK